MIDLQRYIDAVRLAPTPQREGRVKDVIGTLVEVTGMRAPVGSVLEVEIGERKLALEVFGFREGRLLAAPLGPTSGLEPGSWVRRRGNVPSIPVGPALLGRVIDAFGAPLDGGPPLASVERAPLNAPPPAPFARRSITEPIETRVRAIDALFPLGKGQRIGLFAGAGVGKSTLLGMLCRHSLADAIVVGLVGERGREVGDFVRGALGSSGLARSVVVAATSDTSPFVRVRGALAATAIAEHFRDRGMTVLLVMDSITRFAMAVREATLAAGEPPVTKGYTPTVFAALPALLERAGTGTGEGSITAIYTVLVEGDDLTDPIADAVRGILDGHIVLSRTLADRGVFPAIDILKSISRVMHDIASPDQVRHVASVRELVSIHADAADLIQIGAYVAGSDPRIDRARSAMPQVESLLRQGLLESVPRADALAALRAVAEVGQ